MTAPVKFFTSAMQGAPQLTNAWGDLTNLLDACLVNGFNLKTITSLTRSGGTVTATVSTGHLFQVDQVVLIAGATESGYNGEYSITGVTGTTFTYMVSATPATPATGSPTAKAAPLGFEIAFTGTNKRAYRSQNMASNRPYLRVDNSLDPVNTTTYAKKGKVTMAQGMSDIDAFVGAQAPYDPALPNKNHIGTGSGTSAVDGWYKWYYAKVPGNSSDAAAPETSNRNWVIVGDDRGFYLLTGFDSTINRAGYCFTDFESYRAGDGFNTLLGAADLYMSAGTGAASSGQSDWGGADIGSLFNRTLSYTGKVLMQDHVQVGGAVRAGFTSLNSNNGQTVSGYITGIPWPNGPDYSLILHPTYLKQENTHLRGKMPGLMWVHNDLNNSLADLTLVDNVAGYPGRKFLLVSSNYANGGTNMGGVSRTAFDITGPWW